MLKPVNKKKFSQKRRGVINVRSRIGSNQAVVPRLRPQAYQKDIVITIPGTDILVTTNGAGSVALAVPINTSIAIPGFAIKWAVCWDEYCILKNQFQIEALGTSTGVTRVYIDENSGALPIAASAQVREGITLTNNNSAESVISFRGQKSPGSLFKWSAQDVGDLIWSNTTTSPVSITYLKIYTDATLQSPLATTLFLFRSMVTVRFRMSV